MLRVRTRVARIAIVRIDAVAAAAARRAKIARIVVGAHEPHVRIIQPRLRDVDQRHRNAIAGAGAATARLDVGPAGFIEALNLSGEIR